MTAVAVRGPQRAVHAALLETAGVEVRDDAEVLLADPRWVTGDLAGVRWVQSTWAGVDAVEWSALPAGTVLTTLPGVFGAQITEFVMGHLLARSQRIVERRATRTWDTTPPAALAATRLGVLGAGSIGRDVATAARCLGMDVIGCSRSGRPDPAFDRMHPVEDVAAFARGLDHLVVLLPATRHTERLVDASLLGLLHRGASLVNAGRGTTVDLEAVIAAIRSGRLGMAVLDVTDPEPLPDDHPAWRESRIVVTGHTAAVSKPEDVVRFFLDNLRRHDDGEPLHGVVDREAGY